MNRNTENSPDLLDEKIDKLVASQPLQPSPGFADRVLIAIDKQTNSNDTVRAINPWIRIVLPIAALLVAAFVIAQLATPKPTESTPQTLSTVELQEIFILEEGLSGLTSLQDGDLNDADLLETLILINLETQS